MSASKRMSHMSVGLGVGWSLVIGMLVCPSAAWAEWTIKRLYTPQGVFERCVVESPTLPMRDGYQDTQVTVIVSTQTILVKAKAPLDNAFNDIGLQIGKNSVVKAERVVEERSAVFTDQFRDILTQLTQDVSPVKKGRPLPPPTLKLYLRFWPTWPTRGLQTVDVSLEGFRKAYTELDTCK